MTDKPTSLGEHEIRHEENTLWRAPAIKQKPRNVPKMRSRDAIPGNAPVFNAPQMRDIFYADFEHFARIPGAVNVVKIDRGGRRHIYIDRGSPVLGVAHLDTVCEASHFWMNRDIIASPVIDNRLGAWVMLQGLPSMGIYPDILLTEGEEKGQSTAEDFVPNKEYNWLMSFDRTGDDVACYQYLDAEWTKTLGGFDLKAVHGANSDIAYMEGLLVKAMNVGCGMYDYHGQYAYAKVSELRTQMLRVRNFCLEHWETKFPHKKVERKAVTRYYDEDYNLYGYGYNRHSGLYGTMEERTKHDRARLESIMAELRDGNETLGDWWTARAHSKAENGNRSYCQCCDSYFAYANTEFSRHLGHTLCNACFVLEMVPLRIITEDEFSDLIRELRQHEKVINLLSKEEVHA